ncbi:MAG: hypothetical protein ACJ8GO_18935 [Ramlibacter sp.]
MLVQRTPMPSAEVQAFQAVIVAMGRDPGAFRVQVFEARGHEGERLRRVHVVTQGAAVQYEASTGAAWTESFARHLARGFFG